MKHFLTLLLSVGIAASFPTASSAQITYDTVRTLRVAPGMIYTHYTTPSVPWEMDVLQIDMKDPYLKLETAKAQDLYSGLERTSSMAARKTTAGHRVVGAINADFFDMATGQPINIQVSKGEIVCMPQALSTIGFTDANRAVMSIIGLTGAVKNGAMQSAMNGVNTVRSTNYLVLYNSYGGSTTGTNQYGTEVLLRPVTSWIVNDTVSCVVDTIVSGVGGMAIPKGYAVLSGHGTSEAFLKTAMARKDTVKIVLKVTPGPARVKEMLGGYPRIIRNGADYVDQGYAEEGGPDHTYQRHNRTAIGFSADSTKLFLVTIDGRTEKSLGMTLKEVSAFMLSLGVYQGMNFDGGGSTTMVINNKVVNVVTDAGGERPVANAMFAVTTAPIDTLATAAFTVKKISVFPGESYTVGANGWDTYGNILPFDAVNGSYSVSPALGTVTAAGVYTAAAKADSGWMYLVWKGAKKDSARIVIKGIARVAVSPKNIATDSIRTIQYKAVSYDAANVGYAFAANTYGWKVLDPTVASIDGFGLLTGKRSGATKVVASYGSASDTTTITIEIGRGSVVVDSVESLSSWTVSSFNIDTASTKLSLSPVNTSLGKASFKIEYAFTYMGLSQTYIFLEKDTPIYGVPDSLYIDMRSDSASHRISILTTDDDGELYRFFSTRGSLPLVPFDRIAMRMMSPSFVTAGSVFNYPLRLKRIEIQLGSAKEMNVRYAGTIYLDNIRTSYPSQVSTGIARTGGPRTFDVRQNYPNPFNPSTKIRFSLAEAGVVTVRVFDVLGKEVSILVNDALQAGTYSVEWNAKDHPSGMYFYQVRSGNASVTKRMMLLK